MSNYREIIEEAVKVEGFIKIQRELLEAGGIISKDTVGQILINVNNGGITNVYKNVKVK
jgi:aspartate 1-decarboxylase